MASSVIIVAGAAIALWKIKADDQRGEIQDAIRAIRRVLETKLDAPSAMLREGIGVVGFRHGAHWPATKTRKRSGHGLAHVAGSAREDYGKYEGSPAPEEILGMIPEVILKGDVSATHKGRIQIRHKGHMVLLSAAGKHRDSTRWVFHAYKLYPKKSSLLPVGDSDR